MKKLMVLMMAVMFVFAPLAYAGSNSGPAYSTGIGIDEDDPGLELLGIPSAASVTPPGPAPLAGDGVSDGSGLTPAPIGSETAPGPAPNAGDGIPDGSGF